MLKKNSFDTEVDCCGSTHAAKMLGVSVGTIQILVNKNILKAWKTQGGHRRISLASIYEYQRKHNILRSNIVDQRLRVLLIEDDTVTRELLLGYCAGKNLPVKFITMSSGLEALINIANIKPNILMLNLEMPGLDGFELIRTLERYPQFTRMTKFVFSKLTQEEIQAKGGLPESVIVMAKPINIDWFNGYFAAFVAGRNIELEQRIKFVKKLEMDVV
jgi:excisionase family DNA binding protein